MKSLATRIIKTKLHNLILYTTKTRVRIQYLSGDLIKTLFLLILIYIRAIPELPFQMLIINQITMLAKTNTFTLNMDQKTSVVSK